MNAGERKRIAFVIQYDGTPFFGWQLQRDRRTVQGELEQVLSRLFDQPTRIIGSGRTDRGVHAIGQVAAVDAPAAWTAPELRRALNALLPGEVWISHATPVKSDFHPRYDAVRREYIYRVGVDEIAASPFHSRWCWALLRSPSLEVMEEASASIVGDHSFRAFAKAGQEERGDRCIVERAHWTPWPGVGLEFHISANRFLHHMVRYLVGTLVDIGLERRPREDMQDLLKGDGQLETSVPAPPEGLYLAAVRYPLGGYGDVAEIPGDASLPPYIV